MRSDGSSFWAGVTLTALRDDHGELLGFAKVTRGVTVRSEEGVGSSSPSLAPRRRVYGA